MTEDEAILVPGEMVMINLEGLTYSEDGFAMGGTGPEGALGLYEEINQMSYPSCNDFKGKKIDVYHGDVALVVSYAGRPRQINHNPEWFNYDIYNVVVRGTPCQAFRQNLLRVDPAWLGII